jgi:hypothetical protein
MPNIRILDKFCDRLVKESAIGEPSIDRNNLQMQDKGYLALAGYNPEMGEHSAAKRALMVAALGGAWGGLKGYAKSHTRPGNLGSDSHAGYAVAHALGHAGVYGGISLAASAIQKLHRRMAIRKARRLLKDYDVSFEEGDSNNEGQFYNVKATPRNKSN